MKPSGQHSDPPNCACHGVPQYFHRDPRYRRGGFYSCTVKASAENRAYYEANAERLKQKLRDRYDTDPVYRIGKRLTDDARKRRQTLDRRRAALEAGIEHKGG